MRDVSLYTSVWLPHLSVSTISRYVAQTSSPMQKTAPPIRPQVSNGTLSLAPRTWITPHCYLSLVLLNLGGHIPFRASRILLQIGIPWPPCHSTQQIKANPMRPSYPLHLYFPPTRSLKFLRPSCAVDPSLLFSAARTLADAAEARIL